MCIRQEIPITLRILLLLSHLKTHRDGSTTCACSSYDHCLECAKLTQPHFLNDHQAPVALTKEDADAMTARGAAVDMYDREHNDPLAGVFAAKAVIGEATHRK